MQVHVLCVYTEHTNLKVTLDCVVDDGCMGVELGHEMMNDQMAYGWLKVCLLCVNQQNSVQVMGNLKQRQTGFIHCTHNCIHINICTYVLYICTAVE